MGYFAFLFAFLVSTSSQAGVLEGFESLDEFDKKVSCPPRAVPLARYPTLVVFSMDKAFKERHYKKAQKDVLHFLNEMISLLNKKNTEDGYLFDFRVLTSSSRVMKSVREYLPEAACKKTELLEKDFISLLEQKRCAGKEAPFYYFVVSDDFAVAKNLDDWAEERSFRLNPLCWTSSKLRPKASKKDQRRWSVEEGNPYPEEEVSKKARLKKWVGLIKSDGGVAPFSDEHKKGFKERVLGKKKKITERKLSWEDEGTLFSLCTSGISQDEDSVTSDFEESSEIASSE